MTQFSALLIYPNGLERMLEPKNGKIFQLQELYELLECEMIEIIPALMPGYVAVLDEEGKLNPSKFLNTKATTKIPLHPGDYVVGTMLLCPSKMIE